MSNHWSNSGAPDARVDDEDDPCPEQPTHARTGTRIAARLRGTRAPDRTGVGDWTEALPADR
jgi:hypothetical protein